MKLLRMSTVLLALVLPVLAQKVHEPPRAGEFPFAFGPMGLSRLMTEVGVSESQMKQIHDIHQANRHALVDLRAELEKSEGDFQAYLNQPQIDVAQAERLVDRALEARNRLAKNTTMMMLRMRQVLTAEQWRKLREIAPPVPPPPPRPPVPHD